MKKLFMMAIIALAMSSCSKYVLTSSGVLNNSDLSIYKSFTLQEISVEDLPDGVSDTDLIRLYRAMGNELVLRGYTYVESGDADLTLYLGLSTKEHMETTTTNNGVNVGVGVGAYPYGRRYYRYYGPTPYVQGYVGTSSTSTELVTDGILVVDLVANSDNTHVFYTQIKSNIDGEKLILKDYDELAKAAEKAFKKFPIEKVE